MELKRYLTGLDKFTLATKVLVGFVFLLLIAVIIQAVMIYQIRNQKQIVLVPPTLTQQMSITGEKVSQSYLQEMALFLLALKLNVTPKTVDGSHQLFEAYVDSKQFGDIETALVNEAREIKKGDISAYFIPTKTEVDANQLMVRVDGFLNKKVGSRKIPQESSSYLVQFNYQAGTLHLVGIEKVK